MPYVNPTEYSNLMKYAEDREQLLKVLKSFPVQLQFDTDEEWADAIKDWQVNQRNQVIAKAEQGE